MADPGRYRYTDTGGRRSPPLYNPARASMPVTSAPYSSLYSGDLHAMSASHHEGLISRPPDEYRTSAVPVSSTTYAVRKEPLGRSTSVNDGTRVHRVTDHNSKRPIIVTTKHHPPGPRSSSPSRDPYRSSDEGQYYAQPASSAPRTRGASHVSSSTTTMDDEEYQRLKDRTHHDRLTHRGGDPYRPARTGSLYAGPNHRSSTYEFDDDGYEYTKPSDLARYDLDHDQRRRPRRESLDRYYRPTVSISTDLTRPFDQADRRVRGPPPTTWGLDKVNRATAGGIYDGAGSRMPLPPSLPLPSDGRRPSAIETPGSPREELRGNPRRLSLIKDDMGRPTHHADHYYDDILPPRGIRDHDHDYFQDDSVTARGFGIRVDSDDLEGHRRPPQEKTYHEERRDRREPQKRYEVREPKRRSDDDLEIIRHEHDDRDRRRHRDSDYVVEVEEDGGRDRRDRRDRVSDEDEPNHKKDKIRDKVAAGLGIAAASIGLGSAMRGRDDKENKEPSPSRKDRGAEVAHREHDDAESRTKPSRKEPLLGDEEFEIVELPLRDHEKPHPEKVHHEKSRNETIAEPEVRASKKGAAGPSSPRDHSSSADEEKTKPRRRPRNSGFNPNDTAALAEMKARLAELKPDAGTVRKADRNAAADDKRSSPVYDPSPERKPSPPTEKHRPSPPNEKRVSPDHDAAAVIVAAPRDRDRDRERDDSASPSRDLVIPGEKQVRVVPPPKDALAAAAADKKPIKGILKQPRAQFPEEPNPVREGVAPHKDDKTKANVPAGARWTKISRKMVNPDALKIGKERFEVRDDFVIVLRVLSKEEIQAYAAATATLRERRKKEAEREAKGETAEPDEERDRERDRERERERERDRDREREREREKEKERDHDRDDDDEKRRRHRQHRKERDDDDRRDRDRDKERHRRHRQESDDE